MKKNTKKTVKPEIIVNCVDVKTVNDVYDNYTIAKVRAGKPITENQLDEYAINAVRKKLDEVIPIILVATETVCSEFCNCGKKKAWYKRAWNWITGLFYK